MRIRRRQTRGNQYQKVAEQFRFHIVEEGGLKLRVNFDDYLDTGLFLDHRPTRARMRELANGKRFLNLFCLHGHGHGVRGGGRRALEHLRRSVPHLSRLGGAQSRSERLRYAPSPARSGGLPRVARRGRARRATATTSSSSIRPRSRTPSAWKACSTSGAITPRSSMRACACWRPAGCWCSPPMRRSSSSMRALAERYDVQDISRRHHSAGFRAQPAHPPLLRHPPTECRHEAHRLQGADVRLLRHAHRLGDGPARGVATPLRRARRTPISRERDAARTTRCTRPRRSTTRQR